MSTRLPHSSWLLQDVRDPSREEGVFPTYPVESEEQLLQLLRRFAAGEGQWIFLKSTSGGLELGVALGPDLSGIDAYLHAEDNKVRCAVADRVYTTEGRTYLLEHHHNPVEARYLMPTGRVIEIVLDVYRTGRLPDWVEWEPFA